MESQKRAPVVLHVGRGFYKNRTLVVEVFARVRAEHRNAILVLVGAIDSALEEKISSLSLTEAVRVLDYVPPEKMPVLYTLASVLFFPSLYEGFGMPVVEAQMCGTPVVCSDRGSLPEVSMGGFIYPLEASSEMAAKISYLIAEGFSQDFSLVRNFYSAAEWALAHHRLYERLQ